MQKIDDTWKAQAVTAEQKKLIGEIIRGFPDAKDSFEYEDYLSKPSKGSASEFISRAIEDNIGIIGKRENYVGYIARRPRAERHGSHGLFTDADVPIDLSQVAKEVAPTLMARDYKDPTTIAPVPHLNEGVMGTVATGAHPSGFNGQDAFNDRLVIDNPEAQPAPVTYTVRRLTPTECARLQGFPDWWCRDLGTEDPTEEDMAFWADVFETHRKIVTHAKKPKTEKQIRKWLADPYTDSAEYRIWGNGICLANAFFVLAGIAWCAGLEE